MTLVPIQSRLEAAFNATGDESTWTWTDLSADLHHTPVTVRYGRADETSKVTPSSASFVLDNSTGKYTPHNAESTHWPYVRRGTPLRYSVRAGDRHLMVTGSSSSRASTPDHASLDITTDWFIAIEVEPPALTDVRKAVGKYSTVSNQRSILMTLALNQLVPFIGITWSPDGTSANERSITSDFVSEFPLPIWGTRAYAVWLDVDNGAGGVTATFYAAPTIAAILADPASTMLGNPVVSAGTSSVFSSTAPLEVGDLANGAVYSPYQGKIRKVQVRSGSSSGTIVANPDFTTQTVGTTSFTDSVGRSWTVHSPAAIEDWQTRFVGEISDVSATWSYGSPGQQQVQIAGAGVTRRLVQRTKPFKSALYRTVTAADVASNIKAYWPFEDQRDSTTAASPIAGVSPATTGGVTFGSDSTLDASEPVANIAGSTKAAWVAVVPVFSATTWQAELFINVPSVVASPSWTTLMTVTATGTVRQWNFETNTTDTRLRGFDVTGTEIVNTSRSGTPAGNWHNISIRVTQNGGNVDWEFFWTTLDGNGSGQTGSVAGTLGRPTSVGYFETAPSGGISFGHVIVSTGLGGNGWYGSAGNAWVPESAAARIERLGREEDITVIVQRGPELSERMGPQRTLTLLDLLQECADTDGGVFVEQRHGFGLAYRCRNDLYNQDVNLNLDVNSSELSNPFLPVLDDQRIRNDVTARRPNGSSARVVDQASIDTEGIYDEAIERNVETDARLTDQASWRVHHGTWEQMRYPALTINLLAAETAVSEWLHLAPGDRVQITNLPDQHPAGALDLLAEQLVETISTDQWDVTISSSPEGPWEVGIRDSDDDGKRDTGGSTLNTGVDSDDTSFSVATTLGPLWTTAAGEMPIELYIGGEHITATAISGAASPQTFTVTRSVNGVVKSHSSGAAIRLWRPTVRAL